MRTGNKNCPIGVFDSGLGGLTVVKELMRQLPCEDIVYFGDTARVPYGTKSKEAIIGFSRENAKVLLKYKVKMIVVACNSSSSYALDTLKKEFHVPIVGVIHAGANKAALCTRNKRIGVIATPATIHSGKYTQAIRRCNGRVNVFPRACPLFVPLAEEGWFQKPAAVSIAKDYLASLKGAGVDTLILGCTHYPLLKSILRKVMGKNVVLIDSAKEVAAQVKAHLAQSGQLKVSKRKARYTFLISDRPQGFEKIAKRFLGKSVKVKIYQS